uniref:Glycosyltransferase N-terminal domain-containing protein n=1 Tax=Rhizophora mucronata TaxID=61149 RepID=A0A2P2KLZ7_RHIMU
MGEPKQLHVAVFPWLAFGHLIPYLELSKLIAQKGQQVSFISTPRNIQRLPKIPPNLAQNINFVILNLPPTENLPPNAEATADVPFHTIPYLKRAFDGLQDSLAHFLETSKPDWVICDFAPHWLPPVTARLGLSLAHFIIFSAWTTSFLGPSSLAMINGDDPRTLPEHFTVPPEWIPFPSKVAFRLHEAKRFLDHFEVNPSGASDFHRLGTVIAGSDAIFIRSCMELEANFLRLVAEIHGKPAIPLGTLPPSSAVVTEGQEDDTWLTISEWLDKQNEGSVVYVAFGSELTINQEQLTELALGLELSGLPFLWALRKRPADSAEGESVELPDGFEERVRGRGLVWTSWAPQRRIMAHESVGGFLTHCGYSSVLEALYFGLALIMLPFHIDQGLIARVFEEKRVGIEVPRDEEDGSFTSHSVAESLKLVVADKQGEMYKDNAKQMRKLLGDNDVNDRYINQFIEFLQSHRARTPRG